jgi:hypothetical protein
MCRDGKKIYVSYWYGNTPRIASCFLNTDCTQAANWAKVDLGVTGDTSNDYSIVMAASDNRVWVAFAGAPSGGNTPVYVSTCSTYTGCDVSAEWGTPYVIYNTASANYLDIASTGTQLYLVWSYVNGTVYNLKIAKCSITSSCDANTDWTVGNVWASSSIPSSKLFSNIGYTYRRLTIAATTKNDGMLYYMVCPKPSVTDCTNENNWIRTDTGEMQEYPSRPGLTLFDSNTVMAITGTNYSFVRLLFPSLMSPVSAVAAPSNAPSSSPSATYIWKPLTYVDGYENLYDDNSSTVWDNSIYVSDPSINKNSVSLSAGTTYYTSTRSVRGTEISDDAPVVRVRPFQNGDSLITNMKYDFLFEQYSSTVANNTLYVTYKGVDNNIYFRYCNMSNDCSSSSNWSGSQPTLVENVAAEASYPQILVTSNNAYIAFESNNNLYVSRCVLSTGCVLNANWTTTLISSGSGSGKEPSMVFADNRIAIATRDSTNQLRFHYCYDANDCTNIANWTRDVVISADTSSSGHSLGNSAGSFYIVRKTNKILKKYHCYYSNGCESTTDW